MNQADESRTSYALLFLVIGLIVAVLIVSLASLVALLSTGVPITLISLLELHFTNPVFLLLDLFALLFATLFILLGRRQDQLLHAHQKINWMAEQHGAQIHELNESQVVQNIQHKDLEAVMSRAKQHWEATFDSVGDMILLTDSQGVILRCNRATSLAFQTGFRQLIGRQIDELFLGSAQQKLPAEKAELRFARLEGWYEVTTHPLKLDGGPSSKVYVVRDITGHQQALADVQRLNQYYELLVHNSPVAIVTLNQEGRVVECNPAFETLFGYCRAEVVGQKLDPLISPPDLIEETWRLTQAVKNGETLHQIARRSRQDGSQFDVEVFGIPVVLWGKQIGMLGLYHDVSELLRAERAEEAAALAREQAILASASVLGEAQQARLAELSALEHLVPAGAAEQPVDQPAALAVVTPLELEKIGLIETAERRTLEVNEIPAPVKARRKALKIEKVEGIGPVYAQKLAAMGIRTTKDLLKAGKSRKGRQELAEKSGISPKLVLKWVNMADLMRIPGIGEEFSELLEKAGVDTVRELRNRNPQHLHEALVSSNTEYALVRRAPFQVEVEEWIQAAKELEPLVTY